MVKKHDRLPHDGEQYYYFLQEQIYNLGHDKLEQEQINNLEILRG